VDFGAHLEQAHRGTLGGGSNRRSQPRRPGAEHDDVEFLHRPGSSPRSSLVRNSTLQERALGRHCHAIAVIDAVTHVAAVPGGPLTRW
jgi:hypothetical protein